MSYEYSFAYNENLLDAFAMSGIQLIPSGMINLAAYVFTALALYTLANNRGIRKAWLAWIPVVNVWILGSLSDQYRYVVKEQFKSKRKVLLVLGVLQALLVTAVLVMAVIVLGNVFFGMMNHVSDRVLMDRIMGPGIGMLGSLLPLLGIAIAHTVVYYMALYDVYTSCDPRNSVVYLVLSIVPGISTVALPILLFVCRNKDEGMPPRRDAEPDYAAEEPVQWEQPQEEPPLWEQPRETDPWENGVE